MDFLILTLVRVPPISRSPLCRPPVSRTQGRVLRTLAAFLPKVRSSSCTHWGTQTFASPYDMQALPTTKCLLRKY